VIRGALAAALTPLRDGGTALDDDAVQPYAEFLLAGGVAGILALGTTGEGISLAVEERRRTVASFARALGGRGVVIAHCGAQTTADTVALAAAAGEDGADAVAVIAPPYYRLDDRALLAHLTAAARAAGPLPFYVYEFEAAAGYPVPLTVLAALREAAPNLAGLKVSDTPWERFEPYLVEGLDVFVGPEAFITQGMAGGAVGAVSALASAFPDRVSAAVRDPDGDAAAGMAELRATVESFPRHAALKRVVARRGVPLAEDVRPPLRQLTDEERRRLDAWLDRTLGGDA
jgi:dihydrodipicolinate synthase/N-acetylneuraminate lyase